GSQAVRAARKTRARRAGVGRMVVLTARRGGGGEVWSLERLPAIAGRVPWRPRPPRAPHRGPDLAYGGQDPGANLGIPFFRRPALTHPHAAATLRKDFHSEERSSPPSG